MATTRNTRAPWWWVLPEQAPFKFSWENAKICFPITSRRRRPLCQSVLTPVGHFRLLHKSLTLRKSIPKHYISLWRQALLQSRPRPSICVKYLFLCCQSSYGDCCPSVALADNPLPPLSFKSTPPISSAIDPGVQTQLIQSLQSQQLTSGKQKRVLKLHSKYKVNVHNVCLCITISVWNIKLKVT